MVVGRLRVALGRGPPADRRPSTRRRGRRWPLHDGARLPSEPGSALAGCWDDVTWPAYRSGHTGRGWPRGHHDGSVASALTRSPQSVLGSGGLLLSLHYPSRPHAVDVRAPPCVPRRLLPRSVRRAEEAGSGAQLRLRPGALRSCDPVALTTPGAAGVPRHQVPYAPGTCGTGCTRNGLAALLDRSVAAPMSAKASVSPLCCATSWRPAPPVGSAARTFKAAQATHTRYSMRTNARISHPRRFLLRMTHVNSSATATGP